MGSTAALRALILSALCGCAPDTVAECARISDAARRETCRFELVLAQVLPDGTQGNVDKKALEAAMKQIDDPVSRDLILLRLAILAPTEAMSLCRHVETEGAQQKCQQVLGRPHLGTTRKPPQPPPVRPGAPSSEGSAP